MQCVGSETLCHALVHNHDTRTRADHPAAVIISPIDCLLVHQKQSATILLDARLQAVGGSYRAIAANNASALKKNSLPSLRSDDEAGLDYFREYKNRQCLRLTFGSCRILCHELL